MSATEIVEDVWLGNANDAIHEWDRFSLRLCVADDIPKNIKVPCAHIRIAGYDADGIMYADQNCLDWAAALIARALDYDQRVIVFCQQGLERSPLTIAWFLSTAWPCSLDEAYDVIEHRRPGIFRHPEWVRPSPAAEAP